jgi:hypothetical protein
MKVIPFATKYSVSEDGFVYSKAKSKDGSFKKMTGVLDTSTYYRVNITTNSGKVNKYLVHRLVAITYLPNQEDLPEVNHKDGDKLNNCISNLEWVTRSQNIQHSFDTGLNTSIGERNGRSEITEEKAKLIKSMVGEKSLAEISRVTNTKYNIVSKISRGVTWKHV